MENNRTLNLCSVELLDDPALKTTASNYNFKYVPGDQFQKVIRSVQRDRLKQKKDSVWSEFCSLKRSKPVPSLEELQATSQASLKQYQQPKSILKSKATLISCESKSKNVCNSDQKENSKDDEQPKVRVMTDEEIKFVVENAFKEVMERTGNVEKTSCIEVKQNESKVSSEDEAEEEDENEVNDESPNISPKWIAEVKKPSVLARREMTRSLGKASSHKIPRIIKIIEDPELNSSEEDSVIEEDDIESPKITLDPKDADEPKCTEHFETTIIDKPDPKEKPISIKSVESSDDDEPIYNTKQDNVEINKKVSHIIDDKLSSSEDEKSARSHLSDNAVGMSQHNMFPETEVADFESEVDLEQILSTSSCKIDEDTIKEKYEEEDVEQKIIPMVSILPKREQNEPKEEMPALHQQSFRESETAFIQKECMTSRNLMKANPIKSPINSPQTPHNVPKKNRTTKTAPDHVQKSTPDSRTQEMQKEKIAILAKITEYQNKMIQLMHSIKQQFGKVPEADGCIDQQRRERRADEFNARFSRNHLYQIGRMIEDIRIIPKELYLLKYDNDFRMKVCTLYGTLHQALQSYLKFMINFMVDRNPKKLLSLIDFISASTKMCVHKKVFDRNDSLIQELLYMCKGLKRFLQEMELEIPEVSSTQKPKKTKKPKNPKPSQQGDARQNKALSMYNTKKVDINPQKHKLLSGRSTNRSKTSVRPPTRDNKPLESRKGDKIQKPGTKYVRVSEKPKESKSVESFYKLKSKHSDKIYTQIETIDNDEIQEETIQQSEVPYQGYDKSTPAAGNNTPRNINIKNTVFEALENITKQQVQEILGPLMSNLGVMFHDAPPTNVHSILNTLKAVTSQLVNVPSSEVETFNQQDALKQQPIVSSLCNKEVCGDNTSSVEQQLALSQSKQQSEAGAPIHEERKLKTPFGEHYDDGMGTSHAMQKSPKYLGAQNPEQGIRRYEQLVHDKGGSGAIASESDNPKVEQLRYERNVHFTFIKSDEDNNMTREDVSPIRQEHHNNHESNTRKELNSKYIEDILKERNRFIQAIADNPLYGNEVFSEPWKVVTRIANKIVEEAVISVENSVNFGEEKFVKDFIRMELDV